MKLDLKTASARLDAFKGRLAKLSGEMDGIGARAGAIARQLKRSRPVRDDSFEADFNSHLEAVKAFMSELDAFAREFGDAARALDGGYGPEDSSSIKNLVFQARNASLEADKFCASFRGAHREGKGLQLKLNWWMIEAYCSDLEHLVGKLLFAAREFAKAADARPGQAQGGQQAP